MINIYYLKVRCDIIDNAQVYLVAGGMVGREIFSIELLRPSASTWTTTASLPPYHWGLKGATLNNKIVMAGYSINAWPDAPVNVYEFDPVVEEWTRIGNLKVPRQNHAVSVVNYNSIKEYCN